MENIQLSLFGKMCPERSIVIKDTIFYRCSGKSQRPIFQCLNVENGQKAEWFNAGGGYKSLGDSSMLNIGECPNEENASFLSQVLDAVVPSKYYLSPKACLGILRRADRRKKELPTELREALISIAMMQEETEMNR